MGSGSIGPAAGVSDHGKRWWRASFRLNWPDDMAPDFSYHLLIADQALAPVIDDCRDDLVLWRFHRRAARDQAGHIFSFVYYADQRTAERIRRRIESDRLLMELADSGTVEKISFTNSANNNDALIESTSDPQWPLEIQRSWPYFIMGVSQSWLDLIARERDTMEPPFEEVMTGLDSEKLGELIEMYRELNKNLVIKWGRYGRHAYLHHLNALFGYTPVYMYETGQWQQF